MKPSKYNFVERVSDEQVMIYNSRTGAIVLLPENQLALDLKNSCFNDATYNFSEFAQEITILKKEGIIVEDDVDELSIIRSIYEENIYGAPLKLTIIPTEECNFRCPYCFLYDRSDMKMDNKTKESILLFIDKWINDVKKREKAKYILINWFGGEPTLNSNFIVDFMEELKKICLPEAIQIISNIVTNGYFLNCELLERLLKSGIKHFQVTLDGSAKSHDQTRYLANGKGTFDIIYSNLLGIYASSIQGFTLDIRCNFKKDNIGEMEELIDLFNEDFKGDPRFHIYFRPVSDYETKNNSIEKMKEDIFDLREGKQQQNQLFYKVKTTSQNASERRIVNPLPMPTRAWCNANCEGSYMIGPGGVIYPCDTLVGSEKVVGHLNSDGEIVLEKEGIKWKENFFETDCNECMQCKILPLCFGGCIRSRLNGIKSCYWQEEDIFSAMKEYYSLIREEDKNGTESF